MTRWIVGLAAALDAAVQQGGDVGARGGRRLVALTYLSLGGPP